LKLFFPLRCLHPFGHLLALSLNGLRESLRP
jgi:hypothetical protein